MKTIIYRKDTLQITGTLASNETVEQVIEKDVIPNFSGEINDYASLAVHYDYFHLELQDGEVIAVEDEAPPPERKHPTETEMLMDYVIDVDYRLTLIELGLI